MNLKWHGRYKLGANIRKLFEVRRQGWKWDKEGG